MAGRLMNPSTSSATADLGNVLSRDRLAAVERAATYQVMGGCGATPLDLQYVRRRPLLPIRRARARPAARCGRHPDGTRRRLALAVAKQPGVIFTFFRHMMRVPGSDWPACSTQGRVLPTFVWSTAARRACGSQGQPGPRGPVFFADRLRATAPSPAHAQAREGEGGPQLLLRRTTSRSSPPRSRCLESPRPALSTLLGPAREHLSALGQFQFIPADRQSPSSSLGSRAGFSTSFRRLPEGVGGGKNNGGGGGGGDPRSASRRPLRGREQYKWVVPGRINTQRLPRGRALR